MMIPCERCGRDPAVLTVIGEREGKAVAICRACRRRRVFPVALSLTLAMIPGTLGQRGRG